MILFEILTNYFMTNSKMILHLIGQSLDWFTPDWFVIDGYSNWLCGNWITELLLDGAILIFIQWLLKEFLLGC